jgi:thymidine kinase
LTNDLKRYAKNAICTHDESSIEATHLSNLVDIFSIPTYATADTIFIEEAQFFPDLYEVIVVCVEDHHKHVIISGLDGDYRRIPFRHIVDLIPFADSVEKKTALCIDCRDGTSASFSKRICIGEDRTLIGGIDEYKPVCRFHYNQNE